MPFDFPQIAAFSGQERRPKPRALRPKRYQMTAKCDFCGKSEGATRAGRRFDRLFGYQSLGASRPASGSRGCPLRGSRGCPLRKVWRGRCSLLWATRHLCATAVCLPIRPPSPVGRSPQVSNLETNVLPAPYKFQTTRPQGAAKKAAKSEPLRWTGPQVRALPPMCVESGSRRVFRRTAAAPLSPKCRLNYGGLQRSRRFGGDSSLVLSTRLPSTRS